MFLENKPLRISKTVHVSHIHEDPEAYDYHFHEDPEAYEYNIHEDPEAYENHIHEDSEAYNSYIGVRGYPYRIFDP